MSSLTLKISETSVALTRDTKDQVPQVFPREQFDLSDFTKLGDDIFLILQVKHIEIDVLLPGRKASMKESELRKAVQFQVEHHYPSIVHDLIFDFEVLGEESGKTQVRIYLIKKSETDNQIAGIDFSKVIVSKLTIELLKEKSLNFPLPKITESNARVRSLLTARKILGGALILFLGLGLIALTSGLLDILKAKTNREKTDLLEKEYSRVLPIYKSQEEKIKALREKKTLDFAHVALTEKLNQISKRIPEGVYLTRIEKEKTAFALEGYSRTEEKIFQTIKALNSIENSGGSDEFREGRAELKYSEKTGEGNVFFKISLR